MKTEHTRIIYLVQKHLNDTLNGSETLEFRQLLQEEPDLVRQAFAVILEKDLSAPGLSELPADLEKREERTLGRIFSVEKGAAGPLHKPGPLRHPVLPRLLRIAAVLTIILLATGAFFLLQHSRNSSGKLSVQPRDYVRHVVLGDGTSVVLQKGASLELLTADGDTTRELRLKGEAYFRVRPHFAKSDSTRKIPFIIHTGELKTTVLGTAFTIHAPAHADEITVAVAEGKVRVENREQVLGVLLPNEQIRYRQRRSERILKPVDFAAENNWLQSGMVFEEVPLEQIVKFLEKRYSAKINISGENTRRCLIVTSFAGVETLPQVLESLCTLVNASFNQTGPDTYTIEGRGCN